MTTTFHVFFRFARVALLVLCMGPASAFAASPFITVASTSSTQNSGLFGHILPKFKARTGIEVRVVAVGTGAAIRLAQAGDADVLLVHHRQSEEKFVADGFSQRRYPLMYNDFLIIGPTRDPAGIKGMQDVANAMAKIAAAKAIFASRGDDSGTHKRELSLWTAAGVNPAPHSGSWYRETGSGMGATLNISAAMGAYSVTDRGTWLSFENKQNLVALVEGDSRLRNDYGVLLVSEKKHPHVKTALGQIFIDWLLSEEGAAAINEYKINGEVLFHAAR
ncbi:MAG: substrate-binding domain-containing protein [Alphaproteobacteria bacterium]|nr:substrate-binding domain-containing protein [Alphaproteobacteria bacterium]